MLVSLMTSHMDECTRWFQPLCYKRPPLHAWLSIPGLMLYGSIHSISISLLIWLITSKKSHHTRKYVYSRLYTCMFVSILCVCPYNSLSVSVCPPGLCLCAFMCLQLSISQTVQEDNIDNELQSSDRTGLILSTETNFGELPNGVAMMDAKSPVVESPLKLFEPMKNLWYLARMDSTTWAKRS